MIQQPTLTSSLQDYVLNGLVEEVLYQVKSGKEASVFCCRAPFTNHSLLVEAGALVAAKIYRPAEASGWGNEALRAGRQGGRFRNDAMYRAGQGFTKRRDRVAFEKKSRHGRALQFGSWLYAEWENLKLLHQAGADVPRPLMHTENSILMEYIGDEEESAPILNSVELDYREADTLWQRLLANVELMLSNDRVHADLSAFNVLYWEGEIKVIDLPQAVDARKNPNAYTLLQRDIGNAYRYFYRLGVEANPERIAADLWATYRRGRL
ncbi:MAG: RIO1 family regulatory kinase/ATPase [Dehalococcoidia bacterium]